MYLAFLPARCGRNATRTNERKIPTGDAEGVKKPPAETQKREHTEKKDVFFNRDVPPPAEPPRPKGERDKNEGQKENV
jgi:hypothetical protein